MNYVYLISKYNEYGAENVAATLDRNKVLELFEKWFKDLYRNCTININELEDFHNLKKELNETDEELAYRCAEGSGINLSDGWGGSQLHVVKLQ